MILFLLDFLIYNYTSYSTYFILLNLMAKKNYKKLILIGLILDFFVLNTYFKNTLILIVLILINKYILNFNKKNIVAFLAISIINYRLFIIFNSVLNHNLSFFNISTIIVNNYFLYFIICLLYFNKFIKEK